MGLAALVEVLTVVTRGGCVRFGVEGLTCETGTFTVVGATVVAGMVGTVGRGFAFVVGTTARLRGLADVIVIAPVEGGGAELELDVTANVVVKVKAIAGVTDLDG